MTTHGLCCSHFTACTHHSTLQHPPFVVCLRHFSVSDMEEQQNVPQPNWTTWWYHACYTGIPWLSSLHCLQQLQAGACSTPTEQPLSLTQESNGTLQSPLSSISSQVLEHPTSDVRAQTGPLCSVPPTHHASTADASTQLSISEFLQLCFTKHPFWRTVPLRIHEDLREAQTTFANAATQLSFAGCLESCNLSSTLPPCPNPSPTLLLDAATQTPSHSAAFADATTQLPLTEFFLGCIYSKDPLDRSVPPPALLPSHSASLPQPSDIATINSFSSTSSSSGPNACTQVSRARLHSAPPPPSGLEDQAPFVLSTWDPCESSAGATPFTYIHLSSVPAATCKYHPSGTHADRSSATYKRSASTAPAGTHHANGADPRAGRGPFPKPRALVFSMLKFGKAKSYGLGHIDTADTDLMHHQYRLSVLQ